MAAHPEEAAMGEIVSPAIARLQALGEQVAPSRAERRQPRAPGHRRSALAAPHLCSGSLREIAAQVPHFERQPVSGIAGRAHAGPPHLDVILRRAGPEVGLIDVPVAMVPRHSRSQSHARVIAALDRALVAVRANPGETHARLALEEFGASMALALDLPRAFEFDPGDGHGLGLRLTCFNKVTGSGPRLMLSWHRAASDASIAVGITRLEYRVSHRTPVAPGELIPSVQEAVARSRAEAGTLAAWREQLVTRARLAHWTDGAVRRTWGPRAAARIFHIAMTGWDAEPAFGFERVAPSRRTMRTTRQVPAAPRFAETVFDALLTAAWVASQEHDWQERADRVAEVTLLMRALLRPERGQ
jgi:hypothetical protein